MLIDVRSHHPFRIAVVGSGPAGLYAAEALAGQSQVPVQVDVLDRLPTPYGLVRYGVAPDHQKIKAVTGVLQRILEHPRVRFLGNVEYGRDLTSPDLTRHYDAVIYAVGAATDRSMGIPGETLAGSLSATQFVAWYNGHPDRHRPAIPASARSVAVVGIGNVALDVTRILAKPVEDLRPTDIADDALEMLAASRIADIYMLGRRGPHQASFTLKELKEFGELTMVDIIVRPEDLMLTPQDESAMGEAARRVMAVLQEFAHRRPAGRPRRIHLRFLQSTVEIIGRAQVEGLRLERNRLDEHGRPIGTGSYETLPVQAVLRAVGYAGRPVPGLPFDERSCTIPNDRGRVLQDGAPLPGAYVTGWIKRGPRGIIGTNKACAVETVTQLLHDVPSLTRAAQPDPAAVPALLAARGVDYVTLDRWLELDRHEQQLGRAQGRARVKLLSRAEMLGVARGAEQESGAA
jgi:ferredoxin--NADP+ reductase